MKVFYCTDHASFWPVGCASVVVARDASTAHELLRKKLTKHGLDGGQPFTLKEIDIKTSQAYILNDGEY